MKQPELDAGSGEWDERLDQAGEVYRTAVLSVRSPDGFPFSVRVPVSIDSEHRRLELDQEPVGAPLAESCACLTFHDHAPDIKWFRNFQVRGNLVRQGGRWALAPKRLIGGFEIPPTSRLAGVRANIRKIPNFRRRARRELERRRA